MDITVIPKFSEEIQKVLVREEKIKAQAHEPSGKVSAGMMAKPVLEGVLQMLGVPSKEFDAFTLGKFARGNQAEEWFLEHLIKAMPDAILEPQYEIEYQGGIGFVDVMEMDIHGEPAIPHEVKSVTNRAYKYICEGEWYTGRDGRKHKADPAPNLGHSYQATFYALSVSSEYFFIHYVAADDLRSITFKVPTRLYADRVNAHIKAIRDSLSAGKLPDWEGFLKWHGMKVKGEYAYTAYPQFCELTGAQAEALLERDYPEAYIKLKGEK